MPLSAHQGGIVARHHKKKTKKKAKRPLRTRVIAWIFAGLIGIVTPVATAIFTDFGRDLLGSFTDPVGTGERLRGDGLRLIDVKRALYDTGNFVFPHGLTDEQLQRLNEEGLTEALIRETGAVEVGQAAWEVSLQGRRSQPVEIVDIQRQLVGRCGQPLNGTLVQNFNANPGEKISIFLGVDDPRPVAMQRIHRKDGSYSDTPYFRNHKISLGKGEVAVLVITAETSGPSCRWKLVVDYLADGKRYQLIVTGDKQQPFAISGQLPPKRYDSVILSPRGCPRSSRYQRLSPQAYARLADAAGCS